MDSRGDGGVGESESGGGELRWVDAGAGEESFVGHFAEGQAEGEVWRAEDGRSMDGLGEGAGELRVGDGVWGGEIDRAGEGRGIEKKQDCGDRVFEADPAHPLLAGAERATEAETEDGKHFGECAGAATDDDTKAEMDDADAGLDGRLGGGFPLPANIGQKTGAGGGSIVEQLIFTVAVDPGGRSNQQCLWRVAQLRERAGESVGGLDAALGNFALICGGPAMSGDV